MTLVVAIAALVVALLILFAFAAGRVTAGSRYRCQLSALNEKHRHSLDGLAAVIENLRKEVGLARDPSLFRQAIVRAAAHLLWAAQDSETLGKTEVTKARRAVASLLLSNVDDDAQAIVRAAVKQMTGEVPNA